MDNNLLKDKALHISKFIPGIAWFFVILVLICLPSDKLPEVDEWMIVINYDKLIHIGIFAVLAYLFMYPISRSSFTIKEKWNFYIKIAIATVIWGLVTELIQKFFIPSRSFSLSDFAADGIGGIVALIFFKTRMAKRSAPSSK